ncbi:Dynein regulatory complex subunit 7 [Mortierella claussenii]|nr:Dynein regulatory complex subunit 7 [Mortierella claussenii]
MTSDYSPYQRFHAGACTPDYLTFLTVGNADAVNTGSSGGGFMMAYSVAKGTWTAVSQAVSGATNSDNGDNRNGDRKQNGPGGAGLDTGISAAGRTMPGFALAPLNNSSNKSLTALGVVVGGGWLPPITKTPSALATDVTNLVAEVDLVAVGSDSSVGSLTWTVAPNGGNGGSNVNSNLGPLAGTKILILSTVGKAVVLGGVTSGQGGGHGSGLSFGSLPIIDMTSGAVVLQKTQSSIPNGVPPARYGHCAAFSADGNTIYMFGGSLTANDKITNDLYAIDVRTWTWFQPTLKSTAVLPPPVRDHQCIVVGDQFLSLLGFNTNQAPASSAPISTGSSSSLIPPPPPIYILSTSQWVWSTQYTPLPGTPSPPPPPNVPTDGNKGKISGAGIAFGVIFGLAFIGVIGYLVFSHKRRQKRKAETLLFIEMENRKKEETKLEKERQKRIQDGPLPPTPPTMIAQAYHANSLQDYPHQKYDYHGEDCPYPPLYGSGATPANFYQAQDPFQNPNYHQYDQQYQLHHATAQTQGIVTSLPFSAHQGLNRSPFDYTSTGHAVVARLPHPGGNESASFTAFIPEEMGRYSPNLPAAEQTGSHLGWSDHASVKVPVVVEAGGPQGRLATGARDKMSFIEPASSYR